MSAVRMRPDFIRSVMIVMLAAMATFFSFESGAQQANLFGTEPEHNVFAAPVFPGAEFIRVTASIDPFYESVMFVSSEPVGDVLDYYKEKLSDVRRIQFKEEFEWVWVYLLKSWIPMPKEPTREDLAILDNSPNVMVRKFQPDLFIPMMELMQTRSGFEARLKTLESAKSIIRFTYRKRQNDIGFTKLQGVWENVDRDLPEFQGSLISFNPDSSYVITLSDDNIEAIAAKMARSRRHAGKSVEELKPLVAANNPERGTFAILRNTIDLVSESPVIGTNVKGGLVEIRAVMFSVQLVNMPKLTFIKKRDQ